MLSVKQINRGIVIDHIEAGLGERILKELKLSRTGYTVAMLRNVASQKYDKKDIIKIDEISLEDIDLNVLGLIDPNVTVNIIENGTLSRKITLVLPEKVEGIFKCKNPRCVSTVEDVETTFYLTNAKTREYRCEYCDARVTLRR